MGDDRAPGPTFDPVDGREVLERLAALPIEWWACKTEPTVRHIGPMAQDFAAAFKVGDSDRYIDMVDGNGVVMAAIQGLYQVVKEQDARIRDLELRLAARE